VVNQFFGRGEMIAGTKYFYDLDHLGNVRELTDSTGAVKTRYSYDPYGQVTQTFVSGTVASDFQYAGYYFHVPSGLNLTRTRAYSTSIGRFINRDTIGEAGGVNLYRYVGNNPISRRDPRGTLGEATAIGTLIEPGGGTLIGGIADIIIWGGGAIIGAGILAGAHDAGTAVGQSLGRPASPSGLLPGKSCNAKPPANPEHPNTVPIPTDPGQPPAPGWTWVGGGAPGVGSGEWTSPGNEEALHPDLEHGPPEGAHWDYTDPDGHQWRIFPDGRPPQLKY